MPGPGLTQPSVWVTLNDVYSYWFVFAIVAVVLFAWTVRAIWPLTSAARSIRSSARQMRSELVQTGNETDVTLAFPRLSAEFRSQPFLGDSWWSFSDALVIPESGKRIYRQTVPASDFFNLDLLGIAGADLRSARAHSNTLVGVGLVLTFLGLVLALKAAGGSLGAADPGQVREGLAVLLGTAATKFSFSVVALLLSIGSAAWVRSQTRRTEDTLSRLIAALDRRFPPLSPQEVAAETQTLLRGDTDARKSETDRFAEIIADRFDQALSARLKEAVEPLAKAINDLNAGVSERNRKAIEQMAEAFLARLEGSAGTQIRAATTAMERVGGHVSGLADTLSEVREGLAGAGVAAAQEISQAASDAVRGIADAVGRATEAVASAGPEWERSTANASAHLRDSLLEGTSAFRAAIDLSGETLEKKLEAAAGVAGDRLIDGARKVEERLSRAATDAGREIRSAGGSIAEAGTAAQRTLTEAAETSARRIEGAARAIESSSETSSEHIKRAALAIETSGESTAKHIEGAARLIERSSEISAQRIERAGRAMETSGESTAKHIEGASQAIENSIAEVGTLIKGLASALRDWSTAAEEGGSLVVRAASALDAAASRLTEASAPQELVIELRAAAARLVELAMTPVRDVQEPPPAPRLDAIPVVAVER